MARAQRGDTELLARIRRRYDAARDAWRDIREEGATDMRFVAGDPWDPKDRATREDAGRPCLSLDELGQYFNAVINDVRANPRGVKFSPTGGEATEEAAEFYQNKMREIEYRSHAQVAYTTAFENAVQRSYGWLRVSTKYADDRSFNQDIWIEAIPNPDQVLPDPDSKAPDSSDLRYLFNFEQWPIEEFERRFPQARKVALEEYAKDAPSWLHGRNITVAEYWEVEEERGELLLVEAPSGQTGTLTRDEFDKLPASVSGSLRVLRRRDVATPKVRQYLTNGVEILERKEWAGKFIPFVSCFGKVLYVDDGGGSKRKLMSMTRLARDPYMLYCYYRTSECELVGMTPKFPYFVYEGQLSPEEFVNLQKSLHEPIAAIKVKPTVEGAPPGAVLPMPQRQPYEPPIMALEAGAEAARRAIQSAMGSSFLPTSAQRRNEKSGVALRQIEDSQQRGSFHFVDHYDGMVRQVGVIVEDLMDKIIDTPRETGVRLPNDEAKVVTVNDPNDPKAPSTKGSYLVTISTGPAYESQREAASEFADQLAQNPQIFSLLGPMIVKLKNLGPIGDEMAKALEVVQPPEVRQALSDGKPDEVTLMQKLNEAGQMVQALSQELQARTQQVETEAVKAQRDAALEAEKQAAETQRELARIQADKELKALDAMVKIVVAEIGAATAESRAHGEMALKAAGFEHEHAENAASRAHDAHENERGRQAAAQDAEAGRAFEADQAERAAQREAERPAEGA